MKKLLSLLMFLISLNAYSGTLDTPNVKVKYISAFADYDYIMVHTDPQPNISGLSCSDSFWLLLYDTGGNFGVASSLLEHAQKSHYKVTVTAEDNGSNQYCKLNRITVTND